MDAKILHFNGELKPWFSDVWLPMKPAPLCFVATDLVLPQQTTNDQWATLQSPPIKNYLMLLAATRPEIVNS